MIIGSTSQKFEGTNIILIVIAATNYTCTLFPNVLHKTRNTMKVFITAGAVTPLKSNETFRTFLVKAAVLCFGKSANTLFTVQTQIRHSNTRAGGVAVSFQENQDVELLYIRWTASIFEAQPSIMLCS